MANITDFAATLEQRAVLMHLAYGGLEGVDLLRAVLRSDLAGTIALVSSFGADSGVLLHMVSQVAPKTPVLFLDTGMHFGQTASYGDQLASKLGLSDVRVFRPDPAELASEDPHDNLWKRSTDACCGLRKVRPLARALEGFDGWITGRRRHQMGQRVDMPSIESDATHVKLNPLSRWSQADVDDYFVVYELDRHPLYTEGFHSIGCWPCTQASLSDADLRSGRWADDEDKTECGIHVAGFDPSI
jgi:phosphoadenosine phosphosulfate reductase